MEEKAIDRNELRAVKRLSKAVKEAERAKNKCDLLFWRWVERHREFFQRLVNNPKERRKFQRSLNKIANN